MMVKQEIYDGKARDFQMVKQDNSGGKTRDLQW